MKKPQLELFFVLPPERLAECYELDNEEKINDAFLIYDHFYHAFLPEIFDLRQPKLRLYCAILALQRLQERGESISTSDIETITALLNY